MGPRKPRRPKPKKRARREPKLDPREKALVEWYFERQRQAKARAGNAVAADPVSP